MLLQHVLVVGPLRLRVATDIVDALGEFFGLALELDALGLAGTAIASLGRRSGPRLGGAGLGLDGGGPSRHEDAAVRVYVCVGSDARRSGTLSVVL